MLNDEMVAQHHHFQILIVPNSERSFVNELCAKVQLHVIKGEIQYEVKKTLFAGNYQVNSFALIESDWASNLRFVSLLKKNKQWTRRSLFGREIRQHLLHLCEIPQPPKMKSLQRIHLLLCLIFTIRWIYVELMLHINILLEIGT